MAGKKTCSDVPQNLFMRRVKVGSEERALLCELP